MKKLYVEVKCEVILNVNENANIEDVLNEMEMISSNESADIVSSEIIDTTITDSK